MYESRYMSFSNNINVYMLVEHASPYCPYVTVLLTNSPHVNRKSNVSKGVHAHHLLDSFQSLEIISTQLQAISADHESRHSMFHHALNNQLDSWTILDDACTWQPDLPLNPHVYVRCVRNSDSLVDPTITWLCNRLLR